MGELRRLADQTRNQREFSALGTTAFVSTTADGAIDEAERALRAELSAIDRTCSRFRPDSEISHVHLSRGYPVVVSRLLADAISVALWPAAMTDGAVDPTIGRSLVELGYDRDFDEVPADRGPVGGPLRPAPGWRCIELDAENLVLRVPPRVLLDLGATAKALAADRAADRIAETTGSGVLDNLGGDISVPAGSCGLAETERIARFMASESAGQCGPCLFGLPNIADDLRSMVDGSGGTRGRDRLLERCGMVAGRGACRHPDGVVRLVRSALDVFSADISAHVRGVPCPGSRWSHVFVARVPHRKMEIMR